jgi:hypothetical protein
MGYITLAEARAEGITEEMASDPEVLEKIDRATARIDELTGQWFEPRPLTLLLDGEGSRRLSLTMPIIEITEIIINGSETPVPEADYVVYNRHMSGLVHGASDDRDDPHIDYGTVAAENSVTRLWPKGRQNISVDGTFGYTDPPGPPGTTPLSIKRACMLMVVQDLPQLGDPDSRLENFLRTRLLSEKTRDQSQSYGTPRTTGARGYLTGNEQVDQLLEHFMSPLAIGAF